MPRHVGPYQRAKLQRLLWTPDEEIYRLALWLQVDLRTLAANSSAEVTAWRDKSPALRHNTRSPSAGVLLDPSRAGGRGAVRTVAGGVITGPITLSSNWTSGTSWTVFFVGTQEADNLLAYFLGGAYSGLYVGGTAGLNFGEFDGANVRSASGTATQNLNTRRIYTFQPTKLYIDGVEPSYENTQTVGSITFSAVGCRGDDANLNYRGDVNEIICIPSTLSLAEVYRYTGYLAWQWWDAGSNPLRGDHPFKNRPPLIGD